MQALSLLPHGGHQTPLSFPAPGTPVRYYRPWKPVTLVLEGVGVRGSSEGSRWGGGEMGREPPLVRLWPPLVKAPQRSQEAGFIALRRRGNEAQKEETEETVAHSQTA